jgi:parallel beta-helix repeat protein
MFGKATGTATWRGLRIDRSPDVQIDHAYIRGAQNGIYVHSSKPVIENSVLTGNVVGIYAREYGSSSHPSLRNCLITRNRQDGVVLIASSATIERCTISRNGGWGIRGEYYASPSISGSVISENRSGGIWCWLYTCKVTAHGSIIAKNREYDVSNGSPETWDFSGNWWGAAETQLLKSKGDTVNLRSIHDGRDKDTKGLGEVILSGFLEKEPADVGSSLSLPRR